MNGNGGADDGRSRMGPIGRQFDRVQAHGHDFGRGRPMAGINRDAFVGNGGGLGMGGSPGMGWNEQREINREGGRERGRVPYHPSIRHDDPNLPRQSLGNPHSEPVWSDHAISSRRDQSRLQNSHSQRLSTDSRLSRAVSSRSDEVRSPSVSIQTSDSASESRSKDHSSTRQKETPRTDTRTDSRALTSTNETRPKLNIDSSTHLTSNRLSRTQAHSETAGATEQLDSKQSIEVPSSVRAKVSVVPMTSSNNPKSAALTSSSATTSMTTSKATYTAPSKADSVKLYAATSRTTFIPDAQSTAQTLTISTSHSEAQSTAPSTAPTKTPAAILTHAEKSIPPPWTSCMSSKGTSYYYNTKTGQSKWLLSKEDYGLSTATEMISSPKEKLLTAKEMLPAPKEITIVGRASIVVTDQTQIAVCCPFFVIAFR